MRMNSHIGICLCGENLMISIILTIIAAHLWNLKARNVLKDHLITIRKLMPKEVLRVLH